MSELIFIRVDKGKNDNMESEQQLSNGDRPFLVGCRSDLIRSSIMCGQLVIVRNANTNKPTIQAHVLPGKNNMVLNASYMCTPARSEHAEQCTQTPLLSARRTLVKLTRTQLNITFDEVFQDGYNLGRCPSKFTCPTERFSLAAFS